MRRDYKYIEKATDLVMCITTIGSDYIEELYKDDLKIDNAEGLDELLLYLEEDYLILKNGSTLDDWVDKINKDLADNYRSTSDKPITREHILEGIKNGWIGFKTVIWDEGVQIGPEEEVSIFRITIPTKKKVDKKIVDLIENNIEDAKIEQLIDKTYIPINY